MTFPSVDWMKDAAERVVMTGLVAFATAWLAGPSLDHDIVKSAVIAGVAAGLTLAKTLLTGFVNGTPSAVGATATPSGRLGG